MSANAKDVLIAEQLLNTNINKRTWGDIIFNVKAYGAKGDGLTDDTAAIQAAINALPARGGIVYFPAGVYNISSTITIGDGTPTSQSTKHGIKLIGGGGATGDSVSNLWYTYGVRLKWTGAANGIMIKVCGPIMGVEISGFQLDCNDIADTGLKAVHAASSKFSDLDVVNYVGTAYILQTELTESVLGVAYGACDNEWTRIFASSPQNANANGMYIGSTNPSVGLDYCRNTFKNFSFQYGGAAGSYGLKLGYTDNNTFIEGMCNKSSLGTGGSSLVFEQVPSVPAFPLENVFVNCAMVQGVTGTSGTSGNFFLAYPTSDGAPIPALDNVFVMTYDGKFYSEGNQARRINQIIETSSQTTATTNSTSFSDIADMTTSITVKRACKLKISFSARANKGVTGSGFIRLMVDTTAYGTTQREVYVSGGYDTVAFDKVVDVAAGTHSVKIQYRSSDTNTLTVIERVLIIEELY